MSKKGWPRIGFVLEGDLAGPASSWVSVFGHPQCGLHNLKVFDVGDEWFAPQVLLDAGFQDRKPVGSGVYPPGHPADVMGEAVGAVGHVQQYLGEDDLVGRIRRLGCRPGKIVVQLGRSAEQYFWSVDGWSLAVVQLPCELAYLAQAAAVVRMDSEREAARWTACSNVSASARSSYRLTKPRIPPMRYGQERARSRLPRRGT